MSSEARAGYLLTLPTFILADTSVSGALPGIATRDTLPSNGIFETESGTMIERLKQAFALAEQRSEQEQQLLADLMLEEMRADERWETLFADPRSDVLLARMVAEAEAEDDAGDTEDIAGDAFA